MKNFILISIFALFLTSCDMISYDDAREYIRQCKADPLCYEIVDDTIQDELSARGIQGGTMNGLEMKAVYDLYESFKPNASIFNYYVDNNYGYSGAEEPSFPMTNSNTQLGFIFGMLSVANNQQVDFGDQIDMGTFFTLIMEFETFELKKLYKEGKQYMLIDNVKHILIKIGNDRYQCEMVSSSTTLSYYFDLTF